MRPSRISAIALVVAVVLGTFLAVRGLPAAPRAFDTIFRVIGGSLAVGAVFLLLLLKAIEGFR